MFSWCLVGLFSQEEISEMSQKWQEVWNERSCLWISQVTLDIIRSPRKNSFPGSLVQDWLCDWNKNIVFLHYALTFPSRRIHGTFSWQFAAMTELMPYSCGVKRQEIPAGFWMQISLWSWLCDRSNSYIWTCHVFSQTRHFISIVEMCLLLADTCWKFHLCKIQKCSFWCSVGSFCVIQTHWQKEIVSLLLFVANCWLDEYRIFTTSVP